MQIQNHLQSLLGWYLQHSNLQEQVFPFNLLVFSAETVTLLRKCLQFVLKEGTLFIVAINWEGFLKVVVTILLKTQVRIEAVMLNM